MPEPNQRKLSEAQLELMNVIWQDGEATVTEVWQAIVEKRNVARTTVMTMMSRLAKKGWLRRRISGREYVYSPTVEREDVVVSLVSTLRDVLFAGSRVHMVMALLDEGRISREEAEGLRKIIDEAEEQQK